MYRNLENNKFVDVEFCITVTRRLRRSNFSQNNLSLKYSSMLDIIYNIKKVSEHFSSDNQIRPQYIRKLFSKDYR